MREPGGMIRFGESALGGDDIEIDGTRIFDQYIFRAHGAKCRARFDVSVTRAARLHPADLSLRSIRHERAELLVIAFATERANEHVGFPCGAASPAAQLACS